MLSRGYSLPGTMVATAGVIALLLMAAVLSCGCLDVEPEELPPPATLPVTTPPVIYEEPANTTENESSTPPPVTIIIPKMTKLYSELDYPAEVKDAVSGFSEGRTSDTINSYLRWESVRARTSRPDAALIQEQVGRINYAIYNTTLKEDVRLYIGVSGEQAKRIRNESVFSENGYLLASYDPSIIYHRLWNSGRDADGYLTMCVIDFRRGDHILYVNTTEREFLIPHGGIWDVAREDMYNQLAFSADSVPRFDDMVRTKVRLIYTREHP